MGALIRPVIYAVFIAAAILGFAAGCERYHSYTPKHGMKIDCVNCILYYWRIISSNTNNTGYDKLNRIP